MLVRYSNFDHPIHIYKPSKQIKIVRQNQEVFSRIIKTGAENLKAESPPPMRKMKTRHIQGNFQNLSPNSRTQAIAQGQREMMEMVKNMPESCYELTLKDIVDHHRIDGEKIEEKQRKNLVKRSESGGKMIRTSSSDHNEGLLLKVVFPVFIIGKKKKRPEKGTKLKVSPKPENSGKSSKMFGKEGWKWMDFSKPSSSEIESGSRISSTGSNNGRQRKKSGCLPGYFSWCFLSNLRKTSAK